MIGQYETIYTDGMHTLQANIFDCKLMLVIKVFNGNKTQIFQTQIESLKQFGFLEKLCENFEEVLDMIKNIKQLQYVEIKMQRGILKILQKHPTKKQKIVSEISIVFKPIEVKQKQLCDEILQQICKKCQKEELKNEQIKSMFCLMGKIAEELLKKTTVISDMAKREEKQRLTLKQQLYEQIKKIKSSEEFMNKQNRDRQDKIMKLFNIQSAQLKQHSQKYEREMLKNSNYQKQISKQINSIKQLIKFNENKKKAIADQSIVELNQKISSIRLVMQKKLNQFYKITSNQIQNLKGNMKVPIQKKFMKKMIEQDKDEYQKKQPIKASDWVDLNCYDYKKLAFENRKMVAKKDSYVFGNKKLTGHCSYSIKIIKNVEGKYILVGLADMEYKYKSNLGGLNNRVAYRNDGRYCGPQRTHKTLGFKVGQIVTVALNLDDSIVQWKVGSEIRHEANVSILADKKITWVPCIVLCQDSSIQIID